MCQSMGTRAALQALFVAVVLGIFQYSTFVGALYDGRGGKKWPIHLLFLSSSVKPVVPRGVIIICGATFYKDDDCVFKAVLFIKKH